jgi:micrococcal nuclease
VLAAAVLALVLPTVASAAVRKVSFTTVVSPNDYASLTVNVSPRARCTIKVVYDTTVSHARGLGPKTGSRITWRWKVGSSTHPGRWPVTVDCGSSGKLSLRLRVLAS